MLKRATKWVVAATLLMAPAARAELISGSLNDGPLYEVKHSDTVVTQVFLSICSKRTQSVQLTLMGWLVKKGFVSDTVVALSNVYTVTVEDTFKIPAEDLSKAERLVSVDSITFADDGTCTIILKTND